MVENHWSSLSSQDIREIRVVIYALVESDTGLVRYIGRSHSPASRFTLHRGGRHTSPRIARWVAELGMRGESPVLKILETVPAGQDSAQAELRALEEHAASGLLLNTVGVDRKARTRA